MPQEYGEMSFEEAMDLAAAHTIEGADQTVPDRSHEEQEPEKPKAEPTNEAAQALEAEAQPSEPPPSQETQPPVEQPPDRSWTRLMAREQAFLAEKEKFEQERAAFEAERGKRVEPSHWREDLAIHPVQFLRDFLPENYSLQDLAQDLWYEAKGVEAPATYRATREARGARLESVKTRREVASQREGHAKAQPAQQDANAAQEAAVQSYVNNLQQFASSELLSQYPAVAAFAKKYGLEGVTQSLFSTAQGVARETRGARVLTPEQAAEMFEKELRDFTGMITSDTPPAVTKAEPQGDQAQISLRNKHQSIQPDKVEEDPMSDEALRRKAAAAIGIENY